MQRLDVPRLTGVVLQRLAQLPDAGREGAIAHGRLRPHCAEHLVLRDDVARSLEQEAQEGKRLGGEADLLPAAPEATPRVQPVVTESNRLIRQHFPCASFLESPERNFRASS